MRAFHALLLGLSAWAAASAAQTPQTGSSAANRTFEFTVFGIGVRPEDLYYLGPREVRLNVRFQPGGRSQVYTYAGPVPLVLYRDVVGSDGVHVRKPAAQIEIPQGAHRFLVLLGPTNREDLPFAGVAVEDSVENLRAGMLRVLNYSGERLTALVGAQVYELSDGPSPALVLPSDAERFPFQVAAWRGNRWKLVLDTHLERTDADRVVAILLPADPPNTAPKMRLLRERVKVPEPEARSGARAQRR